MKYNAICEKLYEKNNLLLCNVYEPWEMKQKRFAFAGKCSANPFNVEPLEAMLLYSPTSHLHHVIQFTFGIMLTHLL